MNTIIAFTVFSSEAFGAEGYSWWWRSPALGYHPAGMWPTATSCADLSGTCTDGCGAHAVFADCKSHGGSCTPYSFMPNIDNQDCSWMDKDGFSSWGFLQYSGEYSYQAFAAKHKDGSFYDDVWILHGCDGAGIQTDCKGDIFYLEHFGSKNPVKGENCEVSEYGKTHKACPTFYHQGKGESYPDYTCGWWRGYDSPKGIEEASKDGGMAFGPAGTGGDYSDSMRSILANCPTCAYGSALINPYKDALDSDKNPAFAYFVGALYPWICTSGDGNSIPYTGREESCYCDNEPDNGRKPDWWTGPYTPTYPKGTQIVYCGLYQQFSGQGHSWDPVLVCDFITLDPSNNQAVANQRGVAMYPTSF